MTKKIPRQSECLHPLMLILFEYPFLKLSEYVFLSSFWLVNMLPIDIRFNSSFNSNDSDDFLSWWLEGMF